MNVGFTTTDLRQRYIADVHSSVFSTIVSAHQSVGKTFLPVDRQEPTLGSPNVVLVRGVANLVVMLADIAVAVHDGRQ